VEVLAFREAAAQTLIDLADRFVHLSDVPAIFVPSNRG
ncbi:MAG: NYN domain-containing protein, partial [Trueperaceae bacterium]